MSALRFFREQGPHKDFPVSIVSGWEQLVHSPPRSGSWYKDCGLSNGSGSPYMLQMEASRAQGEVDEGVSQEEPLKPEDEDSEETFRGESSGRFEFGGCLLEKGGFF